MSNFDREQVRGWIEAATGEALTVSDALPDTLAATSEALGLEPRELRLWIFDHHSRESAEWSSAALVDWARCYGFRAALQ